MQRPEGCTDSISNSVHFSDFKDFIHKIKDSRSSSPSGRHYGHCKVLLHQDEKYLRIVHGILTLARKHCIVLSRWKTIVTSLIEKKVACI